MIVSLLLGKSNKAKSDDRRSMASTAFTHLSEICSNHDAPEVVFPSEPEDKASLRQYCPDPVSEEIVPVGRRFDGQFFKLLRAFVVDMLKPLRNPINIDKVPLGETDAFHYFKKFESDDDPETLIAATYLMEFNKVWRWWFPLVIVPVPI